MKNNIKVQIKKLDDKAVIPKYAHIGDAGLDLVATSFRESEDGLFLEYGTSLAIKIPEGHVGLLFPRSSISKLPLSLCNSVGVIDSNYLGEIKLRFRQIEETLIIPDMKTEYEVGDRVGQLMIVPYPSVEFVEVDELGETDRGEGGFGSSGN